MKFYIESESCELRIESGEVASTRGCKPSLLLASGKLKTAKFMYREIEQIEKIGETEKPRKLRNCEIVKF